MGPCNILIVYFVHRKMKKEILKYMSKVLGKMCYSHSFVLVGGLVLQLTMAGEHNVYRKMKKKHLNICQKVLWQMCYSHSFVLVGWLVLQIT